MSVTELIEQLQLTVSDHPEAADFDVMVNVAGQDVSVFAVSIEHEELKEYSKSFVRIECYRPYALERNK